MLLCRYDRPTARHSQHARLLAHDHRERLGPRLQVPPRPLTSPKVAVAVALALAPALAAGAALALTRAAAPWISASKAGQGVIHSFARRVAPNYTDLVIFGIIRSSLFAELLPSDSAEPGLLGQSIGGVLPSRHRCQQREDVFALSMCTHADIMIGVGCAPARAGVNGVLEGLADSSEQLEPDRHRRQHVLTQD